MKKNLTCLWTLILVFVLTQVAIAQPTFKSGEDPKPSTKSWSKVSGMSDEFNDGSFNTAIWQKEPVGNGWSWIGRAPGLFNADAVSENNGNLKVEVSKYNSPVWKNGKEFLYEGAIVRSIQAGQVGMYFEAKMKANRTPMSSTFWLMSKNSDCMKKHELDIQECVGTVSSLTNDWAKNWNKIYHSNAIHRSTGCHPDAVQKQAQFTPAQENWERYYIYGAWWKSENEVLFFLDGEYKYTIYPSTPFDMPMWIQMAIETYDWNPVPAGGAEIATGNLEDRTTMYDWVRVWKLENAANEAISFKNNMSSVQSQKSYTVPVNYTASASRDVIVEFWKGGTWLGSNKKTVSAGSGTAQITVNLNNAPALGNDYVWKTSIRPVGTDWKKNIKTAQVNNVSVTASQIVANGQYEIRSVANGKNVAATNWSNWAAVDVNPASYKDQRWNLTHLGNNIYSIQLTATYAGTKFLEVPYAVCNDGTLVSTYSSSAGSHQRWKIEASGSSYVLKPTHCLGKALDIRPADDKIHIWQTTGSNNQKWNLIQSNLKSATSLAEDTPAHTQGDISIYPNPVKDHLYIKTAGSNQLKVSIYTMSGSLVLANNYQAQSTQKDIDINVSDLNSGCYLLKVSSSEGTFTQKVIKQ